MKFIHLSDLHLGKRVNNFSMIEDQKYILNEIIKISDLEKPDAFIIAGDIFDNPVAQAEAMTLFDEFLVNLSKRKIKVFIISGNHDSPERLSFGSRLMKKNEIYVSPVYDGNISPIILKNESEDFCIYLLPFIKPIHVKTIFQNEKIETWNDALQIAIKKLNIDKNKINILVTHQFVTGAKQSDSEEFAIGGCDNIDSSVFMDFDYVALGHIHSPQNIKIEKIRYCGTPLKYSFSEINNKNSVTIVEIKKKNDINISTIPLIPLRNMREIKGTYNDLTLKKNYENTNTNDYIHAILTDENDIPDALMKLRSIYPNLMKLDYDNNRTRNIQHLENGAEIESKTNIEHFSDFFEIQNNQKMTDEQLKFATNLMNSLWEEIK